MSKKLKSFNVAANVNIAVSVTIEAATLAEAVRLASELKTTDFITVDGEYLADNEDLYITGVYE